MPEPDGARIVRDARAVSTGFKVRPPARLSQGPTGIFLGAGSGTSVDFHEFREYQPGDDLRRVDWSVYARSESLVVRLYQIEVSPVVEILLDGSASMGAYEGKRAAATWSAAFLAGAARQAEGRPVLVMPGQRLTGEGIEQALASMEYGGVEDPLSASHWPRGTGRPLRFLISDLLFPVSMERHLSTLRRDAAALVVIQVLSRTERDPSFTGGLRLVDAESPARKRDLRVDRGVLRRYRGRLATHLGSIDGAARKVGALVVRVDVDDLFRDATSIRDALVPPLLERGIVEVA